MQAFLRDTEQKQSGNQTVKQLVVDINTIANHVVAILETYSLEAGKGDDDGFASRFKACACICRKEKKFYNVVKEIQSIKKRIMDIIRKRETYGVININNDGEGTSNQDVVQTLLDELLKAEPRRRVLSIYGMGGLGKTTLARNSTQVLI
ncbi:hypothetical protein R3W88_000465 [Solanum pinnatisectum]|uniref:Uncharacterized protein n=1 Tax=Solanum pinnatisectum TaxID=50273 RepID=A0AAV9MH51_9SOLN|nr:hypothetical protein R3W88_000465 [Solanum pinnatisectum]